MKANLLIAVLYVSMPVLSFAETSPTYEDVVDLQGKNYFLQESLKLQKIQSELDQQKTQKSTTTPSNASLPGTGSYAGYSNRPAQVEMIAGIDGKLVATIQLQDGSTMAARIGTKIPNVGVVESIAIDEVIVKKGKEKTSLPFVYVPMNNSPMQQTPASPYVPPIGGIN